MKRNNEGFYETTMRLSQANRANKEFEERAKEISDKIKDEVERAFGEGFYTMSNFDRDPFEDGIS